MAEPTDVDLERAEAVCVDMPGVDFDDNGESWREKVAYVAQALADECERARAPFLAVADDLHQRGTAEVAAMNDTTSEHHMNQCASRAATYARAENLIRQAARFRQ